MMKGDVILTRDRDWEKKAPQRVASIKMLSELLSTEHHEKLDGMSAAAFGEFHERLTENEFLILSEKQLSWVRSVYKRLTGEDPLEEVCAREGRAEGERGSYAGSAEKLADATADKEAAIMLNEKFTIKAYGISPSEEDSVEGSGAPEEAQVTRCEVWLAEHARPQKNFSRIWTSYGLKVFVENWLSRNRVADTYVSNGAFIEAARRAGYRMTRSHPGSPNVCINIKLNPGVK
jgi:hypothetical protein